MDEPGTKTPTPPPPPPPPKTPIQRPKTSRKELDTITRQKINDMRYIKPCKKPQQIADITGIPRSTIINICERDEDLTRTMRPNRHRPVKISRERILEIEADMDDDWGKGSMEAHQIIDEYDLDCTPTTLYNSFKREGVGHFWAAQDKFLTAKNQKGKEGVLRRA